MGGKARPGQTELNVLDCKIVLIEPIKRNTPSTPRWACSRAVVLSLLSVPIPYPGGRATQGIAHALRSTKISLRHDKTVEDWRRRVRRTAGIAIAHLPEVSIDIIIIFVPDQALGARFRPVAEPVSELGKPAFRTNETILGNPRNGAETKRA